MNSLLCCYFPTKIIFVDDDSRFLKNREGSLDDDTAVYGFFDNPRDALDFINTFQSHLFVSPSFAVPEQKIAHIHSLIDNADRYDEISTAIVDYNMPGMNGLEFFSQLKNPHIRKILYTGVADEKLAIDAFNQGLIDGYISKGNPNQEEILTRFMRDSQLHYFRALTDLSAESILKESISDDPHEVAFFDPIFVTYFNDLIEKNAICEYYFNGMDENFILLSETGKVSLLFIYPTEIFDSVQFDIQDILEKNPDFAQKLSPSLVKDLKEDRKTILFSPKNPDTHPIPENWEKYAYPVTIIHGKQPYYVVHVPDVDGGDGPKIVSFQDYKRRR